MEKIKSYVDMSDELLVNMFYNDDSRAFETLLLRHKDRIFTYIYNIVRESSTADDIFQETFIKVITTVKSGRYVNEGKFLGWLIRIAHNAVIDHYRKLAASKTISNDDFQERDLLNNAALCDTSAQDYTDKEECLKDVEHIISLLPKEQQRVVNMRYYKNMSFKEIADIEHISINTALGRMRYALINLRKQAEKRSLAFSL